jgi:type II secretory pathway component PulM
MKKYFDQLRPMERRLVIGVGVVLFIVANWVFVWPYLGEWGSLNSRYDKAAGDLKTFQQTIAQKPALERSISSYESGGEYVQPEDQAVNFMRTVQQQASASGFSIDSYSPHPTLKTNQFFVEQIQNITVHATDAQLVEFLYRLGTNAAMIRVVDLDLQPDQTRQRLGANIKLKASYQKTPKAPAAVAAPSTNAPAARTNAIAPKASALIPSAPVPKNSTPKSP